VTIFQSPEAAAAAEGHFKTVFQEHALPEDMPTHVLSAACGVIDLLVELRLAKSRGEARRLIAQGGVRVKGETVADFDQVIEPGGEQILQVGKRRFVKIVEG
jgi:tyrosyl-tRNA synthetase